MTSRRNSRSPFCPLFAVAVALLLAGLVGESSFADSKALPKEEIDKDHAAKMARGLDVFQKHVRTVLVEKCLKCHGGKATEAGFDLSDRDRLLKGGESGPALLPGKAKDSLLYKLVAHQKEPFMPHQGKKLPEDLIARIAEWIDCGAPYDEPLVARTPKEPLWTTRVVPASAKEHWAFRPLRRVEPPKVKDPTWCRTPIDRFLLAKMEVAGVAPNLPVDRGRLIRRAYFDLVGLPPAPEEVEAFVNDRDPDAYSKLIDRLLGSQHYGERWARHWLDLARFAESHGFEHDYDRPTAYHYRDFVIRALNDDMPYDRFVKWQIAGDEYAPDDRAALAATGFLAAGVHSTQITKNEVERHRYDEMDDQLATLGTALLGLTVGCARCHDHKFDPIPQRDYYRLLATFTTTVRTEVELKPSPGSPAPQAGAKPAPVKALICSEGLPAVRLHTQGGDFLPETHFLRRGDPNAKDGVATQGFLQVLEPSAAAEKRWQTAPPAGWRTSYRRRALAEWLTDVDDGAGRLLARVIVNRLWQHHVGRGLVATPSDFGTRGERPTHPELLDWLASELIANGWRLKPIQKVIMTSAVYLEDSRPDEAKAAVDREDRLFWRRPARRLEGEVIRDSLLAVGGVLDERMYGPGTLDEGSRRRSVYFTVKRSKLIPMLVVFDAPEALSGIGERPTTTIAPQALYLMNNPHVRGYARGFARRVAPDTKTPIEEAVRMGYRMALGRGPTTAELADSTAFVKSQAADYEAAKQADARDLALTDFCQTLMCLNEFVYVD
ncbi:MAG TPA: PSD1 and planctomycete cytochrome C domain-containing protein [Gemmataceae bacterium]|nr:PSD1 and planctomycete cytochrome C domain-containing protein [Gemmataceae bacterium]